MPELPPTLQVPQISTNPLNLDHRARQKQQGGRGGQGRNRLTGDTCWANAGRGGMDLQGILIGSMQHRGNPLTPKKTLESLVQAESSD